MRFHLRSRVLSPVVLLALLLGLTGVTAPARADDPSPSAAPDETTVAQDDQVLIEVLANDVLFGESTITAISNESNGDAQVRGSAVLFTPTRGFSGEAGFDYTVTNVGGSDQAHVTVTVTEGFACPYVGDALDAPVGLVQVDGWTECADPSAHDDTSTLAVGLPGDGSAALLTTGTAAEASPEAVKTVGGTAWNSGVSHGSASDISTYRIKVAVPVGDNCLSFDYVVGSDEFGDPLDAHDGFVASIGANDWSVSSGGPSTPPTLNAAHAFASYVTTQNATVAGPPNGTSYAGVTTVKHAEVGVPPGTSTLFLSVYDGGYVGTATDAAGDTAVFVDNLTTFADPEGCVSPYNQLPLAEDDGSSGSPLPVTTGVPTPLSITDNDYDPDGDPLVATVTQAPAHGSVTCGSGQNVQSQQICTYTSAGGYTGPDSFGYRISDGKGGFSAATVYVTASADDPRTVSILAASGQPDVTVSAQVFWPNGEPSPGTSTQLLVGPDAAGLTLADTVITDEFGYVTFTPYATPSSGTYLFRARLTDKPAIKDDFTRYVDHDPPADAVIAGPKTIQSGVESDWTITMTRESGVGVTSFSGTCTIDDQTGIPFQSPCATEDGTLELAWVPQQGGNLWLSFESSGVVETCVIDVQDGPVGQTGDCSDPPPSPLDVLTLDRLGNGPVTVGDAVYFAVSATRANGSPFENKLLLCGLAPLTPVDCGGNSQGTFTTDGTGHATLCWVPQAAGQVTFGVADSVDLDSPSTKQDSTDISVGAATGDDVPCDDGGPGIAVSTLTLNGPAQGDIGDAATFTAVANLGAKGPMTCSVTFGAEPVTLDACLDVDNGAGSVTFTPLLAGDYTVSVSSGSVSATPVTYHAVDPSNPVPTGTVSIARSPAAVTWPTSPRVTGTLTTQGVAPQSVSVELWAGATPGSLARVGTYHSSAAGALAVTPASPTRRTYYQWRAPSLSITSATVMVTVTPRLTIKAKELKSGKDKITGTAKPTPSGTTITLQRRLKKGGWKTVATTKLKNSAFAFKLAAASGKRRYRVLVPADAERSQATSSTVTLK